MAEDPVPVPRPAPEPAQVLKVSTQQKGNLDPCYQIAQGKADLLTAITSSVDAHVQLPGCVAALVEQRNPELLAARDSADRVVCTAASRRQSLIRWSGTYKSLDNETYLLNPQEYLAARCAWHTLQQKCHCVLTLGGRTSKCRSTREIERPWCSGRYFGGGPQQTRMRRACPTTARTMWRSNFRNAADLTHACEENPQMSCAIIAHHNSTQ